VGGEKRVGTAAVLHVRTAKNCHTSLRNNFINIKQIKKIKHK